MPAIIQVFKSVVRVPKPDYNTTFRHWAEHWDSIIPSLSGFISDNTLFLPLSEKQNTDITKAELIILQDTKDPKKVLSERGIRNTRDPFEEEAIKRITENYLHIENMYCMGPFRSKAFEIFKLEKNSENNFNLYLEYTANKSSIGLPDRNNHRIAELRLHQPIRYRINGKADFTLTGRKQRTFNEFDYIIEFLGHAEKIEFIELNPLHNSKTIPNANCKIINERKILK
jgi:hypothetical protein